MDTMRESLDDSEGQPDILPGRDGPERDRPERDRDVRTLADVGTDERRMHVRAYNHWASLLDGRSYPSVGDLDLENGQDLAAHSVLLDFTAGYSCPSIAWLGRELCSECELTDQAGSIADIPARSLLSRLTDHYLQIIANRAPVGFEAEFVNLRGNNTMYRGILMPLSSDGTTIDFIYGVISWKEIAHASQDDKPEAEIAAEPVAQSHRPTMPVWADGPGASRNGPDNSLATARVFDPRAILTLAGEDEFTLLLARRIDSETVAVIGIIDGDQPTIDRALKSLPGNS